MPTPAQLLTEVAAAVVSLTGAVRLASDYRDDREQIPDGATRYQLRGAPVEKTADNSNASLTIVALEVSLYRKLSGTERAYTEGSLQTWLDSLVAPVWWRAIAAVHEVEDKVEDVEITRVGSVVSATVAIRVSVDA